MKPIEPFEMKPKESPQLRLENLINNSFLFNSNKERISFKNSFLSNMMSLRENDSMGILGFPNEMNLSRRESSIRRDSYQMNRLGQNRHSMDLFLFQQSPHETLPAPGLGMNKQMSVGDFGKKDIDSEFEIVKNGLHEKDCVNLYGQNKLRVHKADSARIGEKRPVQLTPRKTHRDQPGAAKEVLDYLKAKEARKRPKEHAKKALKTSLEGLKEITKLQRPKLNPKLKHKPRFPKNAKLKRIRAELGDKAGKAERLENSESIGSKRTQETRTKTSKTGKSRKNATLKASLKKSFKKKGGAKQAGRLGARRAKAEANRVCPDKKPKTAKKGLLERRGIRESLKHIIEHEGGSQSNRSGLEEHLQQNEHVDLGDQANGRTGLGGQALGRGTRRHPEHPAFPEREPAHRSLQAQIHQSAGQWPSGGRGEWLAQRV